MNEEVRRRIEAGSAEQQALYTRLEALILGLYPDAEVMIYYQLPTYKSGVGQVSLGYWKDGVTLYTTGPQFIADFKEKHPRVKTNKASINFRLGDELPVEDIRGVIKRAMGGE